MSDEFMDIEAAAAFLQCHPVTLSRKALENKIPAYKRFNKWIFKKSDLVDLYRPNKAVDIG